MPTRLAKSALKDPRLENPTSMQTSVTEAASAASSSRARQAHAHQVLVRRLAERGAKQAEEMVARHAGAARELRDRQRLRGAFADEVARAAEAAEDVVVQQLHGGSIPPGASRARTAMASSSSRSLCTASVNTAPISPSRAHAT